MNRVQIRAQILSCTACALSERCKAPVPFSGPSPAYLGIVGEAPGKQEDDEGKPFVGPAGTFLKEILREAGFDLDRTMFMNAASCFPVDFAGKGRTPNDVEVRACGDNLRAQMELSEARYFLLAGGVALKALRPGLKISVARGVPFLLDSTDSKPGERLALATYHPSYLLRQGGRASPAYDSVVEDLDYLRRLMEGGPEKWIDLFPEHCVRCKEWAEHFDNDGFAWCEEHWSK